MGGIDVSPEKDDINLFGRHVVYILVDNRFWFALNCPYDYWRGKQVRIDFEYLPVTLKNYLLLAGD